MKTQEGIYQLSIGLIGVVFCLVLQKWAYLPAILMGVISVIMIRRDKSAEFTEATRLRFRKLNIISLICWGVFALIGFLLLRSKSIGAEGQWFLLSAYLFLVVHGFLMLLPAKE